MKESEVSGVDIGFQQLYTVFENITMWPGFRFRSCILFSFVTWERSEDLI